MDPRGWVRRKVPYLRPAARYARHLRRRLKRARRTLTHGLARGIPGESVEKRFRRIHRMNLWRGTDSRSGPGSTLAETAVVRRELPRILRTVNAQSILDIPCGDFFWMKEVRLDVASYIGADLVEALVEENNRLYGSDRRTFLRLDVRLDRLPKVNLVLCRDCLDHLSFQDIHASLENISRSGATYLLATTYPGRENKDIRSGDWRPLNLEGPPFSLPSALEIVNEKSAKAGYPDKSLGLWRIADIPGSTS